MVAGLGLAEVLYYHVPEQGNKLARHDFGSLSCCARDCRREQGARFSYPNEAQRSGLYREAFELRLHFFTVLLTAFLFATPVNAADSTEPEAITISTSSPGSVYYPYGNGLATMLTKYVGITFTAQASQASAQNVLLLEQRKAMLGFVTVGVALHAWNGTG
jgi:NMT1-like family